MVDQLDARVQRERFFAIVDEVDNILIDEARTPLIISGQAEESADLYFTFARLVPKLKERPEGEEEGGDFFLDLKDKAVSPTEEGIDKIEQLLGIENLYDADPRLARHFDSALKAHALYKPRPRLHRRGRRDRHRRRVHRAARCPAAAGARASTRRSRRRRGCASSASPGRSPRSRSRTTSGCTTSSRA